MKTTRSVLAVCIIICMLLSTPVAAIAKVQDVEKHWAGSTINMWVEKGLIKGFPDGTFRPDNPITRAEFFVLLNRGFGFYKTVNSEVSKSSKTEWYAKDLSIANAHGYLEELPKEMLKPEGNISRQEVVAILGKVLKLSPDRSAANKFKDSDVFADWSRDYIGAATKLGYVKGYTDNTFGPEKNISRAEIVTMLDRSMGQLYNEAGTFGPISTTTTIEGNCTVSKPNVVLRNLVIRGNLYLTEGISDGTVTLDGVTVLGTTTIGGGGKGIYIKDSSIGMVEVSGIANPIINIIAQGKTTIGTVLVKTNTKLEENALSGAGFGEVMLGGPEGVKLTFSGDFNKVDLKAPLSRISILKGTTKLLINNAKDALIDIDKSVRIDILTINNSVKETGKCSLGTANINSSNVSVEATPEVLNKAIGLSNVTIPNPPVTAFVGGGFIAPAINVASVAALGNITVANGTVKGNIGLPASVNVTLSDNTASTASVVWDNGNPSYVGTTAGTYVFTGTLTERNGRSNPDNRKAQVSVIVSPVAVGLTVKEIRPVADITVVNGTLKENIGLPARIDIILSDNTASTANVVWDNGAPAYVGTTAGTYVFTGTLTPPTGVSNPRNLKAQVSVIVSPPIVVERTIKEIAALNSITVANGTLRENLVLPASVGITLSDDAASTASVVWDNANPAYVGNKAGTYVFTGTLTPPTGVSNPRNLKAQVNVIVSPPIVVERTIKEIAALNSITVANGTIRESLGLPASIGITLSDDTASTASIVWDNGAPAYVGTTTGTYLFTGTLIPPTGVNNPSNLKAQVSVIVSPPVVIERNIKGITALNNITVANGTLRESIVLPTSIGITLSDDTPNTAGVVWDNGAPAYVGTVAGTYVFTGTLTPPHGVNNLNNLRAEVSVIVSPPVAVERTINGVATADSIIVTNGTLRENIALPDRIGITLSDDTASTANVVWDNGAPVYVGTIAGTYIFTGTLTPPIGVSNPRNLKAEVSVIVSPPVAVERTIKGIATPDSITVVNGTLRESLVLPANVGIILSDDTPNTAGVVWDNGTPEYVGTMAGIYVFTGALAPPIGVNNLSNLKAQVSVIVSPPIVVGPTIREVATADNIRVVNGTLREDIGLPTSVDIILSDGTASTANVTWGDGLPAYTRTVAGTYEFIGTLTPPIGVSNPNNVKAIINVVVFNVNNPSYIRNIDPNTDTRMNTSPGTTIFKFDSLDEWAPSPLGSAMVQIDTENVVSGTASTKLSTRTPINTGATSYISAVTSGNLGDRLGSIENVEFNLYIPNNKQIDYILIKFYTDTWHGIFYEAGIGNWELTPGWNKIRRTKNDFVFKNTVSGSTAASANATSLVRSASASDPKAILQAEINRLDNFLKAQRESQLLGGTAERSIIQSAAVESTATNSWGNTNQMEIFVVFKNGINPSINIDKVAINTTGRAKVLFTFDDAWLSVLENAYPILQAKGFKATTWVNKEAALGDWDDGAFMNVTELNTLYGAGWDIGNHTVSHPDDATLITQEVFNREYLANQVWIEQMGWTRGARHVCYPSGSFNDQLAAMLQNIGVKTARTTVYGIEPVPISNIYKLKTIAVGRDTNLDQYVKFEIDRAIATGSTLFFMFHRVEETPEPDDPVGTPNPEHYGRIAVSTANFQAIVDYINERVLQGKIDVVTINQWYNSYMEK